MRSRLCTRSRAHAHTNTHTHTHTHTRNSSWHTPRSWALPGCQIHKPAGAQELGLYLGLRRCVIPATRSCASAHKFAYECMIACTRNVYMSCVCVCVCVCVSARAHTERERERDLCTDNAPLSVFSIPPGAGDCHLDKLKSLPNLGVPGVPGGGGSHWRIGRRKARTHATAQRVRHIQM